MIGELRAGWLFELAGSLLWLALLAWAIVDTVRNRRLSMRSLIFIAATTMFWQEPFADWGVYLIYNDKLALMPWRGTDPWMSPNKPWALITGYGWFFAVVLPLLVFAVARVRRARPHWHELVAVAVVTVPFFYTWDLLVEGVATRLGWWSYVHQFGPAIRSDRGAFPLLHPILLFLLWGIVVTWLLVHRDDRGFHVHENLLKVQRVRTGWRREIARVGAWVLAFNLLLIVFQVIPNTAIREAWGPASSIVP